MTIAAGIRPTHLAIVGPTASGKSAIAMALAARFGDAEIVSLDSMQVYRGMDVGTAKPSLADRRRVTHHLVDIVDPDESWSVARTQREARAAIIAIEARRHRAIFVGGTGLYADAVIHGFEIPETDDALRARLTLETAGLDGLERAYARLVELDPVAAARIEAGNRRRIVRALEVIELTGRPFSDNVGRRHGPRPDVALAGIWWERQSLARRIETRIEAMFEAGLEPEVEGLMSVALSSTARQAIGYRECFDLAAGRLDRDGAKREIGRRTRAFARRQRMWFRRDSRIGWFGTASGPERLVEAVAAFWRDPCPEPRVVEAGRDVAAERLRIR